MNNQIPELNIGDKIGFTLLANGKDSSDQVLFFPIVEITERDGMRAYRYEFPDGSRSMAAIRQSDLAGHALEIQPRVDTKMLCLSERKSEFRDALLRGKDNRFEVYADWDKDAFVVVNLDNKNEYRVKLQSHQEKLFGSCECPDFIYKKKENKRMCKHLAEVLANALLTVKI